MTNFFIALVILAASTFKFCGQDIPIPEPSAPPITVPSPVPSPSEVPSPIPTVEPSPIITPSPIIIPDPVPALCFAPTEPIDGSCPWNSCLTTCPPVSNFAIYFEQVIRSGKEVCRGHLGNSTGGQIPGCFQYVEKDRKLQPGDKISFGMSPRTDDSKHDPSTGSDACCWYEDNRKYCELPNKCPIPDGEFKFIGYTGTPCKMNDPFSITCFPAKKGWKALACPKSGTPGFQGTQGCNQRLIP